MKFFLLRIIPSVALFAVAFLRPAISFGQEFESAASDSVRSRSRNAEELIYIEEEHSLDRVPTPSRDSTFLRSGHHQNHPRQRVVTEPTKQVEKRKEEKDDSIMSFNFLYYIFKKFKLSDIVDDD